MINMLFYVKEQNNVEKNRIIKILQIKFAYFKTHHDLIIIASIKCVVDVIRNNTVHTAFLFLFISSLSVYNRNDYDTV